MVLHAAETVSGSSGFADVLHNISTKNQLPAIQYNIIQRAYALAVDCSCMSQAQPPDVVVIGLTKPTFSCRQFCCMSGCGQFLLGARVAILMQPCSRAP